MPEPMQIQRRRTLGWKAPDNGLLTIYVGRPSIWGNPFYIVKERTRSHWDYIVRFDRLVMFDKTVSRENLGTFATKKLAQERAVELFEKWFDPTPADPGSELGDFRHNYGWEGFHLACQAKYLLRNKNLSCWCRLDDPCHRGVIFKFVNGE